MQTKAAVRQGSTVWRIGACVALLAMAVLDAQACTARRTGDEDIAVRRWRPLAEAAGLPASAQQLVPIGSVQAYLVPAGTQATVKVIHEGMLPPLAVLTAKTVARVRGRLRFDDGTASAADASTGQEWLYVQATSYGKAELRLVAPGGWAHTVVLGMVYPQPQPVGDPQVLDGAAPGAVRRFVVDANRNTLWLSMPGTVDEGWRIGAGAETTFALIRVDQLAVPVGDEPRVGLFLVASRSLRSGQIEIHGGQDLLSPKHRHRFTVEARPSPRC